MGNLAENLNLISIQIDKDSINEYSLVPILNTDSDFEGSMAEKISREIYEKFHHLDSDDKILSMVEELFNIPNFIGTSTYYGNYEYNIQETDFCYVVSIAFIS